MSYRIVITKKHQVKKPQGVEWMKVKEGEDGKPVYGYTPEVEKVVEEVTEVYTQTVDELDLVSVIEAVNGSGNAPKLYHCITHNRYHKGTCPVCEALSRGES